MHITMNRVPIPLKYMQNFICGAAYQPSTVSDINESKKSKKKEPSKLKKKKHRHIVPRSIYGRGQQNAFPMQILCHNPPI